MQLGAVKGMAWSSTGCNDNSGDVPDPDEKKENTGSLKWKKSLVNDVDVSKISKLIDLLMQ